MAPRKRKAEEADPVTEVTTIEVTQTTRRVTRSVTRGESKPAAAPAPARKKARGAQKKEPKKKELEKVEEEAVKAEDGAGEEEEKAEDGGEEEEAEAEDGKEKDAENAGEESNEKTIVIEHCKQCNSFKTRANLVKDGLEKGISGITVLLNPDKPRRGCFEIREEGGETFISLLDMKRPFKKMKDLDMEEVINTIVEKIK